MITLRFTASDTFMGKMIRFLTWSDWSHVEFWTVNGWLGAEWPSGVAVRPFNYYHGKFAVGRIGCDQATTRKVLKFAMDQVGKPYDWQAVIGIAFHRDWRKPDKWFCSELVEAAFESADYPLLHEQHVNRITPQDVYNSPLVDHVR